MLKYIFCILLNAFLMLGSNHILNIDSQEFRTKTGTEKVQSYAESNECVSMATAKQFRTENSSIKIETYNCCISDGILGNLFFPRIFSPSKILKLNTNAITTVQILSSLDSLFPEKRWNGLSYDIHPVKDSHRYFIYTLKRILI